METKKSAMQIIIEEMTPVDHVEVHFDIPNEQNDEQLSEIQKMKSIIQAQIKTIDTLKDAFVKMAENVMSIRNQVNDNFNQVFQQEKALERKINNLEMRTNYLEMDKKGYHFD